MQQPAEQGMTDYEQEHIDEVFGPSASTPAKEDPSPKKSGEKEEDSGKDAEKEYYTKGNSNQDGEVIVDKNGELTE